MVNAESLALRSFWKIISTDFADDADFLRTTMHLKSREAVVPSREAVVPSV
jgi:hypothetical protein